MSLITNPGFETYTGTPDDGASDSFTGWRVFAAGGSGTYVDSTATIPPGSSGSHGIKIFSGTSVGSQFIDNYGNYITLVEGVVYTFEAWTKSSGAYAGELLLEDTTHSKSVQSDGSWASGQYWKPVGTSTSWAKTTIVFTGPPGGCALRICYCSNEAQSGQSLYVDDQFLGDLLDFVPTGGLKVNGKADISKNYSLEFEVGGPGFMLGDVVLSQRIDYDAAASKLQVYRIIGEVVNVDTEGEATVRIDSGGDYLGDYGEGAEFVRIGNRINSARRGSIYLTSDADNSPYMDVIDGITKYEDLSDISKIKVRLGKLSGITDPDFGTLTGYGLYTQNAYLKGDMILGPNSSISWANVVDNGHKPADNATVGADWTVNLANKPTRLNDTPVGSGLYLTASYLGFWNGSAWKTYMDSSGHFYLAGSGTHSLTWNGSTLVIVGNITTESASIKTSTGANRVELGINTSHSEIEWYCGASGSAALNLSALDEGGGVGSVHFQSLFPILISAPSGVVKINNSPVCYGGNTYWDSVTGATGPTYKRTLYINGTAYEVATYN